MAVAPEEEPLSPYRSLTHSGASGTEGSCKTMSGGRRGAEGDSGVSPEAQWEFIKLAGRFNNPDGDWSMDRIQQKTLNHTN